MLTASEREKHRSKMLDPTDWPYWPTLPVKNPARFNQPMDKHLGFVTADYPHIVLKERPTTMGIILQLRFELGDTDLDEMGFFNPKKLIPTSDKEQYESMILHRYEDIDALLDDGWVVD